MRTVDPRNRYSRRFLLKGMAAGLPAAAIASSAELSVSDAWAEDGPLAPPTMKTLVKVARDIYPHDFLGDVYYVNAIKPWNGKAASDAAIKTMLEDGVRRLDADAQKGHGVPYVDVGWEEQRVKLLEGVEKTDFFKKLRSDLVVSLYNQHELWKKFGYEGPSADKGGYINRGFNDIDWLPKT